MEKFKAFGLMPQLIITAALVGAICAGGWYGFLKKQRAEITTRQKKLDDLNTEINKGVNLEKKLPELEREIANLEQQLEQLKTIMPPARIDSEIVAKLESLAKRSRLFIKQIKPERHRSREFYDEYPISIQLQANYHDLAKFFDRMAHLPRIFNVSGVNMKASKGARGRGSRAAAATSSPYTIEANFTAMTFIYREGPSAEELKAKAKAAKATKKKGGGESSEKAE